MHHPRTWIYVSLLLTLLAGCTANPPAAPGAAEPTAAVSAGAPRAQATAMPTPQLASPAPATGAARHPFPQHTAYAPGTIKPSQHSQDALDRSVRNAYRFWKLSYLKNGCGAGRFHVDPGPDVSGSPSSRGIAVSEGQGYGMLIAAFMAGADPDARRIFDGIYAFFRDHPSAGSPDLMAWKQVEGCTDLVPGGTHSATDGDVDIAYALLLADRQWGSDGAIDYHQEALKVIAALKAKVVNQQTYTLLLGDWVSASDSRYYNGTRSSDFMLDHLRVYAAATGDAEWTRVADATYTLIAGMQSKYSPKTGLLPDFIQDIDTTPAPAQPNYLESGSDGRYAYNACRAPWRIAIDYVLNGDQRALAALKPINSWVRASAAGKPQNIYGGYQLDGTAAADAFSIAFAAPLGVGAMVSSDNQEWLNALWDQVAGSSVQGYYGDSLKLLSMIVMSGNWWSPRN